MRAHTDGDPYPAVVRVSSRHPPGSSGSSLLGLLIGIDAVDEDVCSPSSQLVRDDFADAFSLHR